MWFPSHDQVIKEYPKIKSACVGWNHYTHKHFNYFPQRKYEDKPQPWRIGVLHHYFPVEKGTEDSYAITEALREKGLYDLEIHAVGIDKNILPTGRIDGMLFNPKIEDLGKFMASIDIWLYASHNEGLGRMPIEAMSAGALVVSSDCGVPYLVNGENCLTFPVKDTKKAIEQIEKVLNKPEMRKDICTNAYRTAINNINPGEMIDNIERFIWKKQR